MSYYGKTITNPAQGSTTEIDWNGSTGMFAVGGTNLRSQTVTLQHNIGGYWVNVGTDAALTAIGGVLFTTSSSKVRVLVTGSGDPLVAVVEVTTVSENKAY